MDFQQFYSVLRTAYCKLCIKLSRIFKKSNNFYPYKTNKKPNKISTIFNSYKKTSNSKGNLLNVPTRSKVLQESFYKVFDRSKISGIKVVHGIEKNAHIIQ